jgi:hypothetical protein
MQNPRGWNGTDAVSSGVERKTCNDVAAIRAGDEADRMERKLEENSTLSSPHVMQEFPNAAYRRALHSSLAVAIVRRSTREPDRLTKTATGRDRELAH